MTGFLDTSIGSSGGVDTGDIGHSLRFRAAASSYLSRAFSSAASTGTISTFVKRGALGTAQSIAGSRYSAGTNSRLEFTASDTITLILAGTTVCTTTAVYRDPTSWLHVVATFAPNGTAYIYVNGTQVASGATGASPWFFTNAANYVNAIGRLGDLAGNYFDGYQARFAFIDGTALTPSSFGYLNTEINEWVSKSASAVKAVVDAGGTNSFMLDFDDPNFATYNVGKDYSSKGNHWTPNNFSLTAGTSYDWMLDVPGNSYPTWNPLAVRTGAPLSTFSAGNLNVVNTSTAAASYTNSTMPLLPGETWFEATVIGSARSDSMVGIADAIVMNTVFTNTYAYLQNGNIYANSATVTTGATYTVGDVIGVKANRTTNKLQFYKQTGGAGAFVAQGTELTINANIEYFAHTENTYSSGYAINFGQRPLNQTGVSQSTLLCQANMPDPAILNPEKHFDVDTYTGTGSAINRTGFLLQPDLIWIKGRQSAYSHAIFDSVRGVTKVLNSNTTDADYTESAGAGLTAFNADGYSLGTNGADASTNVNSQNFVTWLWKAGGAAVTNNAGSISSQVSANVTAGFSIVTYTGNLSSAGTATVGHGLGQAPGLIISKSRNNAGGDTGQWVARHKYLASANHYLRLNTTDTPVDSSANGSMSASTSTVFSTNWTSGMNSNGGNFVAYCFAEIAGYSRIFSYTGNGSADGPFVHCGFKPKFVMLKNTAAGNGWIIWDAVRDTYNIVGTYLQPNVSTAEGFQGYLDFQSNGFKLKIANADANGSGNTIVGIAFADVPAKYALAR